MSNQQKIWLTVALVLFGVAHIGGASMLGSQAKEPAPAQLIHHGD